VEVADAFQDHRVVALLTWWDRTAAPTGKNVPRFRSEFAWCFATQPGLKWDGLTDTVFDIPFPTGFAAPAERTGHPSQKPEALMLRIIDALQPNTLCDPFMGSGTTLVAAKRLGRECVGIEREERYCEIAAKRLAQRALPLEMEPCAPPNG
jgi:DNA modification methylase